MSFFRKSKKYVVSVEAGHLAYVTEDGRVLDLGVVTEEDMRLLSALTETSYRYRGSKGGRRGISTTTLTRLRGLGNHWYAVIKTARKEEK